MNNLSRSIPVKKEILVKVIKAFLSDNFEEQVNAIPQELYPEKDDLSKEHTKIRARILAGLGFSIEETDEAISLAKYAQQALQRTEINSKHLTVIKPACQACRSNTIYVSNLCKGCTAHPCISSCKFGAIAIVNGRSVIDDSKCKKCQMCIKACPYHAIVKLAVPCEDACPVGAMGKDEAGLAHVNHESCISCGKCIASCPFGAIHEKSQIIDILKAIKDGKNVIAMLAPAIAGQFQGNIYQLKTALKEAGFTDVYEVAQGADITAHKEAEEFTEKLKEGKLEQTFMTTSCCAGYNQLVKKHLPEIKPYVSTTGTPAYYISEIIKKEMPDAVTVFVSPCLAKRAEGLDNPNINYVMNCEELDALLTAKDIEVSKCEETHYPVKSSKHARNFCLTGGVAESVKASLTDESVIKPCVINGLNKESIRQLKTCAKTGQCEGGCNLIEVMCCEGGCIGGNATLNPLKTAKKQVDGLANNSEDITKLNS